MQGVPSAGVLGAVEKFQQLGPIFWPTPWKQHQRIKVLILYSC